jgi:serine/threonine-protein kinase
MRGAKPMKEAVERFVREAKIQARLDHPAIVPVYEFGHDAAGLPYFTMKRLAGATLHDALGDPARAMPRLLRAFVDVCHATEFAHSRGVVHRDLKPSNVVLGDYGEVYVLDWGVARVLGGREDATSTSRDIMGLDGETEAGAILGTPGYMAPEQIRAAADVGPPADVYALGSILFEILTGEPLHPRGAGALASTLVEPTHSPTRRQPAGSIAPELDEACVAALAAEPEDRPTASELAHQVQRYLDGDRDVARRRELAAEQLARAVRAAADPARRGEAMRVAGRALALDPESKEAAALVGTLMLEPPKVLPAELAGHLQAIDVEHALGAARTGALAVLVFFAGVPFLLWSGVTSWPLFALFYTMVAATWLIVWRQSRQRRNSDIVSLVLTGCLVVVLSRLFGLVVFGPSVICAAMIGISTQPGLIDRVGLVLTVGLSALLLPIVLEAVGVFGQTWRVADDKLIISSEVIHLGGVPTFTLLIVANVVVIIVTALVGRSIVASRRDAQRQIEIHSWHLRQLLP